MNNDVAPENFLPLLNGYLNTTFHSLEDILEAAKTKTIVKQLTCGDCLHFHPHAPSPCALHMEHELDAHTLACHMLYERYG